MHPGDSPQPPARPVRLEPEVTAHIAKRGYRIYEIGISYSGRTYKDGKKIGWKDGFKAIWCILKYGIMKP